MSKYLVSVLFFSLLTISFVSLRGYAEDAAAPNAVSEQEKAKALAEEYAEDQAQAEKPQAVKTMVSGVGDVGRSPAEFVSHTVEGTVSGPPIVGTLKGIGEGAQELAKTAVKGVYKVATLGHDSETDTLEMPETGGKSDPAKFKIHF